jgi:hypothetical protein
VNVNKNKIHHLIREILGCTCPEEVFDHIIIDTIPDISGISGDFVQIIMGNRLLVVIWFPVEYQQLPEHLPTLMQAGQTQRDRMQLNRFRLVIGTDFVEEIKKQLRLISPLIDSWDEKCHLHVVEREEIKKLGTYGMIRGASQFLVGSVQEKDKSLQDFGYCMEKVILYCTQTGVATCWLGGTFRRAQFAREIQVKETEIIPAITPLGYSTMKPSLADSLVRTAAGSNRRKKWETLFYHDRMDQPLNLALSEAYRIPLEAVRLAPSASNRQPWRIIKEQENPIFHFFLKRTRGYIRPFSGRSLQDVDMGIAMCHFEHTAHELGLAGNWEYRKTKIDMQELEFIASWKGTG